MIGRVSLFALLTLCAGPGLEWASQTEDPVALHTDGAAEAPPSAEGGEEEEASAASRALFPGSVDLPEASGIRVGLTSAAAPPTPPPER